MAHDLRMEDPKVVLNTIEDCKSIVKKLEEVVKTTSDIHKMDLSIGGINALLPKLENLNEPLNDVLGVFDTVNSDIQLHVTRFKQANENITI